MTSHYNKAQNEINDTFQYYTTLLEERKVCNKTATAMISQENPICPSTYKIQDLFSEINFTKF